MQYGFIWSWMRSLRKQSFNTFDKLLNLLRYIARISDLQPLCFQIDAQAQRGYNGSLSRQRIRYGFLFYLKLDALLENKVSTISTNIGPSAPLLPNWWTSSVYLQWFSDNALNAVVFCMKLNALLDDGTIFDYEIHIAHGYPNAMLCEQNRIFW